LKFKILYLFFLFPSLFNAQDNLTEISQDDVLFQFDIRYATTDNFLNEVLYECERCYLLPKVAEALTNAGYYFCDRGYRIKLFDCYRPLSVQKRMWEKLPNRIYVANPAQGSMHNRGAAVDLTLMDINGNELDMGSDYDFFGRASHTDNYNFPEEILANRKILREGMEAFGFSVIQSEWWHFNFYGMGRPPLLNTDFNCED
jgi:zinc D-Ala-D-Ala dipeptidase